MSGSSYAFYMPRVISKVVDPCHALLPAALCINMSTEDLSRAGALLVRQPPLPRGRFDAFVGDLSGVLRGEATPDVLLAYEM